MIDINKEILITKASGETELFDELKLRNSLEKSGADKNLIERIVVHIKKELRPGMKTSKIYQHAFNLLQKTSRPLAARYSLKKSIMDLGPSGHPFEKIVGEVFKRQGFNIEIGKIIRGKCISHEIDVLAVKDSRTLMMECKFHSQQGIKTDVKIALYVYARFEDIIKAQIDADMTQNYAENIKGVDSNIIEPYLITNTKFTSDAIQYGKCANLNMLGWSYPRDENLQNLIEKSGLHPITCLTTLSTWQKKQLLNQNIVLCREISENKNILKTIEIKGVKESQLLQEISSLCSLES